MQLTQYTDYSMRVLIYLALMPDRVTTVTEIANKYEISRSHLVKIVHRLAGHGLVRTWRGRNGGITLAHPPEKITVGDVVRYTESGLDLVKCRDSSDRTCVLEPSCGFKETLVRAQSAFMAVLDATTLADLIAKRALTSDLLQTPVWHVRQDADNLPCAVE